MRNRHAILHARRHLAFALNERIQHGIALFAGNNPAGDGRVRQLRQNTRLVRRLQIRDEIDLFQQGSKVFDRFVHRKISSGYGCMTANPTVARRYSSKIALRCPYENPTETQSFAELSAGPPLPVDAPLQYGTRAARTGGNRLAEDPPAYGSALMRRRSMVKS